MSIAEPAQPQRGQTRDELNQVQRAALAEADEGVGEVRKFFRLLHPRQMLALGDGYPVVIKQLIQGFFLLVWPGWLFAGLLYGVVWYGIVYPLLWLLFWPVRLIWGDKKSDTAPEPERHI